MSNLATVLRMNGDLERAKVLFPDSILKKRVRDPEVSTTSRLPFRFPGEESSTEKATTQQQSTKQQTATKTTEALRIKVKALARSCSSPYSSAKLNILISLFIILLKDQSIF